MNILNAYSKGFKDTVHSLRMVSWYYLVTLVLGLSLALPFHDVLKEAAGKSMDTIRLLKGYDYTVFSEIMHFHGQGIRAFYLAGLGLVLLFMVIGAFLAGGVLDQLVRKDGKFSLSSFFAGCGEWFWRFLRLTFYHLIVQVLVAAIVYGPMAIVVIHKFKGGANEPQLFYTILPFVILHLLIALYFLIIADYARITVVHTGTTKVFKQYWRSLAFVSRRFFATYGLYLLLLVTLLITMFIYFKFSGMIPGHSVWMVLVLLLVQQCYIWLRSAFRVWIYAAQTEYYLGHAAPHSARDHQNDRVETPRRHPLYGPQ